MENSKGRPDCWGDPECYEPDDDECKNCAVQASCGMKAASKQRSYRRPETRTSSYTSHRSTSRYPSNRPSTAITQPPKQEIVRAEPEEDISFGKLLLHNTGLEVLQTTIDELSNSVRAIPRYDYGKFFTRKKK